MKIWSWRQAIGKAAIEPNTKLVLYTLANYMNEQGDGCYPSLDTLMVETGLARGTICKHLDLAIQAGFLVKKTHGFNGQGWARNEYLARYPKGSSIDDEGSSTTELPTPERQFNGQQKAVQPLNSNSPYNSPNKNIARKYSEDFETFWRKYPPNTSSKKEAYASYKKAAEGGAELEAIIRGVEGYLSHLRKTGYPTAQATTWLNNERWTVNYSGVKHSPPPGKPKEKTTRMSPEEQQAYLTEVGLA